MQDVDSTPGIRPQQNLRRRFNSIARRSFPFACTLAMMVLANAPFGLADQAVLLPAVATVSVFFWSVYRPASFPPVAVCLIGVLLDLLGWLPLGVGTLTLLLVQAFSLRWRESLARQSFGVTWSVFAALATGGAIMIWSLTSVLDLELAPVRTALFQAAITSTLYPVVAFLLTEAHRTIADPRLA